MFYLATQLSRLGHDGFETRFYLFPLLLLLGKGPGQLDLPALMLLIEREGGIVGVGEADVVTGTGCVVFGGGGDLGVIGVPVRVGRRYW